SRLGLDPGSIAAQFQVNNADWPVARKEGYAGQTEDEAESGVGDGERGVSCQTQRKQDVTTELGKAFPFDEVPFINCRSQCLLSVYSIQKVVFCTNMFNAVPYFLFYQI
ncbi:hypothetical protein STEG23_016051, partial [Scotinomys teguina]